MDIFGEGPDPPSASVLSLQFLEHKTTPEILAPQNLSRGLVNVAAKLTHNKDVRDLFVDLVEKVSSPVPHTRNPGPQPVLCLSSTGDATCRLGPTVCGTLPL